MVFMGKTFKEFIEDEVKEINKHKWIESEKQNKDLTGVAEAEWICLYAVIFREEWEKINGKIIEEENGMCCPSGKRI